MIKAVQTIALQVSRSRKAEALYNLAALDYTVPSTDQEMKMDWHNATVHIADNVVTATILLSDLAPACFPWIESVWLSEVKKSIAYFRWVATREDEAVGFWCSKHLRENHYFEACAELRKLLVERRAKDRLDNFQTIRDYLRTNYLDEFGCLNGEHSDELIATKVKRLALRVAPPICDIRATEYTKNFYENIIPAVEDSDQEACVAVLQAFQHGGTWPDFPDIINCFEASIAISFLDSRMIQGLWKSASDLSKDTTF